MPSAASSRRSRRSAARPRRRWRRWLPRSPSCSATHRTTAMISLIRTTPPTPPWLGDALARSLREIAEQPDIATLLRYHRFVGTPADREAGSRWLAHRLGGMLPADRIIVTNGTQ